MKPRLVLVASLFLTMLTLSPSSPIRAEAPKVSLETNIVAGNRGTTVEIIVVNGLRERLAGFDLQASLPPGSRLLSSEPKAEIRGRVLSWSQPAGLDPGARISGYQYRFATGRGSITVELKYWGNVYGTVRSGPLRIAQDEQTLLASIGCTIPPLFPETDNDAARDAAGRGQIFESISIPGITDVNELGSNGVALADVNGDGLTDYVATYQNGKIKMFLNQGCFRFLEHPFQIMHSNLTPEKFRARAEAPNLVDFNGDGFLDMLITRNRGPETNPSAGNTLLLSQGAFDVFVERGEQMGIKNGEAYNRQSSIADVNGDGWLDIAIGADNIGKTQLGLPLQRLFIYKPAGKTFEEGRFVDIGGTDLVPGFGGPFACDPAVDRAGPGITLRDLDNDGDVDLVQSYHSDMSGAKPDDPCASGEYDQGVFVWRNLLKETGAFRMERVTDNGLAEYGKLRYVADPPHYETVARAPGLAYVAMADVDNDGLLDVLAVGPASAYFPRAVKDTGRFWRNLGGFRFEEATAKAGLGPLNWTYGEWANFWYDEKPFIVAGRSALQFYAADTVFGDFDNDGWVDFVYVNRSEGPDVWTIGRNVLFLNNRDGTFRPVRAAVSGLDSNSIAAEAADLNGDGLLDLILVMDPQNSYTPAPGGAPLPPDRFLNRVYWNTGGYGGIENHWLRVRFSGISDRQLVGTRVYAHDPIKKSGDPTRLVGMRVISSNQSYKSGVALEAHFGLGQREVVDVEVQLPDGRSLIFAGIGADQFMELDLERGTARPVSSLR